MSIKRLEKEYKSMINGLQETEELSEHTRLLLVGFGTRLNQLSDYQPDKPCQHLFIQYDVNSNPIKCLDCPKKF